jgi:DnaB helicase-like protein
MASAEPLYPKGYGSPRELYEQSRDEAVDFSYRLAMGSGLPMPWSSVDAFVGPLNPGWLVLIGARAKGGKSSLMRELFQSWVCDYGKKILYVGTEQNAGILRMLWAATRLGLDPEAAVNAKHPDHFPLMHDVQGAQSELADRAIIVARQDLDIGEFVRWARVAYREKCDVLMLDHFHRLASEGRDKWQGRDDAVRKIKNVASQSEMLLVAAAQLKNAEGPLGEFEVPGASSWAETSGLRREADVALQAWRPLHPNLKRGSKSAAKDDGQCAASLVQPNTMAIRCDAHRYRPNAPYSAARLYVADSRISSWSGAAPPRSSDSSGGD